MDTKIWIQLDGQRQGPFTLEQLPSTGIRPETPVWYEGLPDWTMACNAPLTAQIFYSGPSAFGPRTSYNQQQPYNGFGRDNSQQPMPPCPPSYLAWAILTTICCCLPLGIVSIIYSSQVSSRYMANDYAGAVRASERAQLWLILSIVCGLLSAPLAYMTGFTKMLFWL